MTERNCLHCVLPPHVLENIARNGTGEERDWALRTLAVDSSTRQVRAERELMRAPVAVFGAAGPHKKRLIHDAKTGTTLPGTLVRSEGQAATGDAAVDEAYDGLGATFDLYWDIYQRDSIDNAGMDLIGTVHYDKKYDNAFWNDVQMVFGDGDGQYFNRFTIAIDIMGHELTHGVTAHQANLVYHGQPGALNESLSDVFGSLVKQYAQSPRQTAADADWLIGAGLFTSAINGIALRSMKAPGTAYDDRVLGKDPQPDHMSKYVNTTRDNGGVHINSGIPNRAFYLAAIALGGYAWEKAGKIWYATNCDPRLSPTASFQDFANLTADNAAKLFDADVAAKVAEAWRQVGINVAVPGLSGDWILHYSWGSTTTYGQASITFNADHTFSGTNVGQWRLRDGTLLLSYNTGPAKYAGTLDSNVANGEMSTFAGLDGAWYLTRKGIVGIMDDTSAGVLAARQPYDAAGSTW
jgi:Zn-dependent metalloprotease